MKRIICALLALLAVCSCMFSCGEKNIESDTEETTVAEETSKYNTDVDIHDIVEAVTDVLSYNNLVEEFLYKEDDPDEMVKWIYGVVDITAEEHLKDYCITMPTDYNQALCVLVFDNEMTEADYEEVKETVNKVYIETRKSSLQMYMPEEYEKVKWQLENTDLIWKQFDNVLVLCEYDDAEPTAAWDALEELFS